MSRQRAPLVISSQRLSLLGDSLQSSITPESHLLAFQQRRRLLASGLLLPPAIAAAASPWSAAQAVPASAGGAAATSTGLARPVPLAATLNPAYSVLEKPTPESDVTGYNNFYEFGTGKSDPARSAPDRPKIQPWTLRVTGLVNKPRTLSLDDILKLGPVEERVTRLRCVEGWSMVVPWAGIPLASLLRQADPQGSAKYVEFVTLADRSTMPGLRSPVLDWPYREGLRLDEALHPLAFLATGVYGKTLPAQNGAPIRLVMPWKYGFKSAKSIVEIRLLEKQPVSSWERAAPQEYGFYANVNPEVAHPRWSQATERRIGEGGLFSKRLPTQMFNGYASQVASLYTGLDLRRYY